MLDILMNVDLVPVLSNAVSMVSFNLLFLFLAELLPLHLGRFAWLAMEALFVDDKLPAPLGPEWDSSLHARPLLSSQSHPWMGAR